MDTKKYLIEELAALLREEVSAVIPIRDITEILGKFSVEVDFDCCYSDLYPAIVEKENGKLKLTVSSHATHEMQIRKLVEGFGFAVLEKGFIANDELWSKESDQQFFPTSAELASWFDSDFAIC